MASLNDLMYAWFGGTPSLNDAQLAFYQAAYTAGVSAAGIIGASYTGSGSPEGVVTAPVGSIYRDTTNGTAYIKNTGTGNTGWKLIEASAGAPAGPAGGDLAGTYPNPTLGTATRATAATDVLTSKVTADANDRFVINADGKLEWGPGNATQDVNLYRSAADTLKTDDNLHVGVDLVLSGNGNVRTAGASGTVGLWASDVFSTGAIIALRGSSFVTANQRGQIQLYGDIQAADAASGRIRLGIHNNGASFTDLVLIDKTGNVGIGLGSTTPTSVLHLGGTLQFGTAGDTNLYRSAADTLKTDDAFHVGAAFRHLGSTLGFYNGTAVTQPTSVADPASPGVIYVQAEAVAVRDAVVAIITRLESLSLFATV